MSAILHSLENNYEYLAFRHWRIINYLDEGSIFNKDQGKKLSVRFKGFLNLSWTMNFVTDWANAKSMAKIWYKFHGSRQIKKPFCLGFPVLFFLFVGPQVLLVIAPPPQTNFWIRYCCIILNFISSVFQDKI